MTRASSLLVLCALILSGCAEQPAADSEKPDAPVTPSSAVTPAEPVPEPVLTPSPAVAETPSTPPTNATRDPTTPAASGPNATTESTTPTPIDTNTTKESTVAPPVEPAPVVASGPLRVHYVNVGQGDATIWELPDGSFVVYDCGDAASSADMNPVVLKLRALGLPSGGAIHALIASHGHLDHIGGCEEVLSEYAVSHLFEAWYDGADAPASYGRFRDQVKAEGGVVHPLRETTALTGEVVLRQWDYLDLPAASGVKAQLVFPSEMATARWDDIAKSSLVVRLTHGDNSFCFQGDIETAQENTLAAYAQDLACGVYLVGHHGSKYASSTPWLTKMAPKHAVVSFGSNSYGHPTSEALCRVQTTGASVYATHRAGDITFTSDGANLTTDAPPETLDYCAAGTSYWLGSPPEPTPTPTPTPTSPPAEPTPQASGPTAPYTVTASPSNAQPCQYATVTISVHAVGANGLPVAGASVVSTWHYKTSKPTESGTTNVDGNVALARSISRATADYTVTVEVKLTYAGVTSSTATSFTPKAC